MDDSDFDARRARGRAVRATLPRSAHAQWSPAATRFDPTELLEQQAESRITELVPVRHGRMMVSAFTFYRGAALLMAADLATLPNSGLIVQLCGDAHLSNFGVFGTPERRMIFDINDFDETLPGPFEWDVKRLAASFEVAGRDRGFSDRDRREIVLTAVRGYREHMRLAARAGVLDAWYDSLEIEQVLRWIKQERAAGRASDRQVKTADQMVAKARKHDSARAFQKLVGVSEERMRILADPPLIVPIEDLVSAGNAFEDDERAMESLLREYQTTLTGEQHPISEYAYVHMARKVVGVGSVGTRAWIVLLRGRDALDPLLLQAKEAQASVLEGFLPPSQYASHGERVVRGQRAMQAATDIFLGWQRVNSIEDVPRDFYLRQLHDWKGSVDVDGLRVPGALLYARLCGEALARAHSRTGDRVTIAAYLGGDDGFDQAIGDFANAYADQNDRDFDSVERSIASGRLPAVFGL